MSINDIQTAESKAINQLDFPTLFRPESAVILPILSALFPLAQNENDFLAKPYLSF